jgi:cysteinyl-tRNA synthetase
VAQVGLRDPREVVAPLMTVLLDLRARVRADKRFDLSDLIRDHLAAINIEVRDTAEGAVWVLGDDH